MKSALQSTRIHNFVQTDFMTVIHVVRRSGWISPEFTAIDFLSTPNIKKEACTCNSCCFSHVQIFSNQLIYVQRITKERKIVDRHQMCFIAHCLHIASSVLWLSQIRTHLRIVNDCSFFIKVLKFELRHVKKPWLGRACSNCQTNSKNQPISISCSGIGTQVLRIEKGQMYWIVRTLWLFVIPPRACCNENLSSSADSSPWQYHWK